MEAHNPVIEKIRKLLALANSSNEHEAALAASHAQRLLSEHNLAMANIESSFKPEQADTVDAQLSRTLPKWLRHLSAGVSTAFDCRSVHYPATGKLTFIGVGADVQIAAYTFAYLNRTIRRLCGIYMKNQVNPDLAKHHRELMRQSYYLGAVSTITTRLKVQKLQTPITSGALVPVKEGLIKQAMNEIGPTRIVRNRRSYINSDAYTRGQDDGRRIGIHQGVASTTSQQPFLKPD